ncbi:hypothetical protein PS941_03648 [Pseudomonas fluorescens]|uniref:Uncharacterized protein n=1 Tax=Pseudomonas fluorescens TaxID=294 RepID=A0A5E7ULL6_PSEFL|nr:hypothetical protein PS941_03648 [Pseudomonas fluorescens]
MESAKQNQIGVFLEHPPISPFSLLERGLTELFSRGTPT